MNVRAAVIGHPISHTLSPAIFRFLVKRIKQHPLEYTAMDVSPTDLEDFIQTLRREPEWRGCNVTIPHKETILKLVDQIAPAAQAVGAGNVIEVKNGHLTAHNTDVIGILDSLKLAKFLPKGKSVAILGAGGAARAVTYACASAGVSGISIYNRSVERSIKLAGDFQKRFPQIKFQIAQTESDLNLSRADMVVQTTPVGMTGHQSSQGAESYYENLFKTASPRCFAFDLIYRPESTPFTRAAAQKGLLSLSGLPMLVGQALATWEIWFGSLSQRELIFNDLLVELRRQLGAAG